MPPQGVRFSSLDLLLSSPWGKEAIAKCTGVEDHLSCKYFLIPKVNISRIVQIESFNIFKPALKIP